MRLQEFITYLTCLLALVGVSYTRETFKSKSENRVARTVFDIILGRIRPCGGCMCGKSNRGGARLLGGEFTETHEFPWLATIHVKNELLVSGILINDRYVLTAASQLLGATAPEIKVSLGEYDRCHLDVSSTNVSVDTVIPHPEFSFESRANDIALIRLTRPTQFERRILPACLPNPETQYLGQVGTLMGWVENTSLDGDNDTRTCRPRKLGLPILSKRECLKDGVDPASYHEESGCIGVIGGGSIICNNDAGSAVLYRSFMGVYDLVGILSDSNQCDGKLGTATFTRVGPYIDWIYQQTKDACYCIKPFEFPEFRALQFAY